MIHLDIQVNTKYIPPQKVAQPARAASWAFVKVNSSIVGEMTQTYIREGKKYTDQTQFWFKPYNYSGEQSTALFNGDTAEDAVLKYLNACGEICGNCG